MEHNSAARMASHRVVVGTRIHWNNHAQDQCVQVESTLQQVHALCARAATFADGVVIAVGLPFALVSAQDSSAPPSTSSSPSPGAASCSDSVFVTSIRDFLAQLQRETCNGVTVHSSSDTTPPRTMRVEIVPMLHWGSFVPALNAIVATAATQFPASQLLLLQSLEVTVVAAGVDFLVSRFVVGSDLVVGAALPGHAFDPRSEPHALDGLTTPWNTLALWDLTQLARIGFPLIGDGLRLDDAAVASTSASASAGVEEVATIALYQHVFPASSTAKVVSVPGVAWQTDAFESVERQQWQACKMASKHARAAKQLKHFGLVGSSAPVVLHLDT